MKKLNMPSRKIPGFKVDWNFMIHGEELLRKKHKQQKKRLKSGRLKMEFQEACLVK